MSKQTKPTPKRAVFQPFAGIDTSTSHAGTPGTADIVNFRLAKDGSLVKREGYHYFAEAPGKIRAAWTGKLFGKTQTILLAGTTVIRLDTESGTITTLGSFSSLKSSAVQFFFYRDRLYLLNAHKIYQLEKDSITAIEAYVPLIGKDWPTTVVGEIWEPRNLLTTRARIHYLIPENPSIFLCTGYSVQSIEALYVNDVLKSASDYRYDEPTKSILMQGLQAGDRVRVHLTYVASCEGSDSSDLVTCKYAEIFGDTQSNRIFLWNGSKQNTFYPSTYVSEEALAESRVAAPNSVPLYFPEHSPCILGDGRYSITGLVRQYDRLLIFSEAEAFTVSTDMLDSPKISARPINPMNGCYAVGACAMADNSPFTIGQNEIYRWTADTDEYNLCNAYTISAPIRALLEDHFWQTAKLFFYMAKRELWIYAPTVTDDVLIYQLDQKAWYRFSGIEATGFFETDEALFLYDNCYIFKFDDNYREDIDEEQNETEIIGKFRSNVLEYDSPRKKQFSELILYGDCDDGTIMVELSGDGLHTISCVFSDDGTHSILTRRLASGRFRHATLTLTADGTARQTIHSLISDVR